MFEPFIHTCIRLYSVFLAKQWAQLAQLPTGGPVTGLCFGDHQASYLATVSSDRHLKCFGVPSA